jgi:hypothetical protein
MVTGNVDPSPLVKVMVLPAPLAVTIAFGVTEAVSAYEELTTPVTFAPLP